MFEADVIASPPLYGCGAVLVRWQRICSRRTACSRTRDRGPVARFFVGSVANYCLRNATMPVVMVRPGERAKTRRSRVVFDDER